MAKKFTHGDAVSHHVFFCVVMWFFAAFLLVRGLLALSSGVTDPISTWGFVIGGGFGLVSAPLRLWLAWPKRDEN